MNHFRHVIFLFLLLVIISSVRGADVVSVWCGARGNIILKSDGTVWTWGANFNGELGDGTTANRSNAVQVTNVTKIVAVSGGDSHSSALAGDGTIWKWGRNDLGELGNGATNATANPFPAKILTDKSGNGFSNVVIMAARDYPNIAVKADGSVWMTLTGWGMTS